MALQADLRQLDVAWQRDEVKSLNEVKVTKLVKKPRGRCFAKTD